MPDDTYPETSYPEPAYPASTDPATSSPETPATSAAGSDNSTTETAKAEAHKVASQAADSGGHVLETSKSEAGEVVAEAAQNARQLWNQTRGELTPQAGTQQQRVASGLQDLAQQLERMGQNAGQSGLASSLVQQVLERARSTAQWMEQREMGDLVTEAQRYASRKPGTFLAAAAALGFLGARVTRGLTASVSSSASTAPADSVAPGASRNGGVGQDDLDEVELGQPLGTTSTGLHDVPTVTTMSHGQPVTYTACPDDVGHDGQSTSAVARGPAYPSRPTDRTAAAREHGRDGQEGPRRPQRT